jgi:hypothetical protein
MVLPSRYFTNTSSCSPQATHPLNTLADFCRTNQLVLQLEPGVTWRVCNTLDFSGIVVDGGGFNLDGNPPRPPHIQADKDLQFDVIRTSGRSVLRNIYIEGGWDGITPGQQGDGIAIRNDVGDQFAYDVYLHNVAVRNCKKRGIYWRYGAYGSIDRPQVGACGLHALEIFGDRSAGKPTTTIRITGAGTLSWTPNGYGAKLTDCVQIDFDHIVMESTRGIQINGVAHRSLNFNAVYQEQGFGDYFIDFGTSEGAGVSITNCVGGDKRVSYPTNWRDVHYSGNSHLSPSAVPLAGHVLQADGGQIHTFTTGGVDVTAVAIALPPGTWMVWGTLQTLQATATGMTQAACCLTTIASDSGLATDTLHSFKIAADQANYNPGTSLDQRLNCFFVYQNATISDVIVYLRARLVFSGPGALAYRGFINAVKIQ